MKIYRVSYRDGYDEHQGYDYFTDKSDAKKADNSNKANQMRDDIEEIEIPLTKSGVMQLLKQWASHPYNS